MFHLKKLFLLFIISVSLLTPVLCHSQSDSQMHNNKKYKTSLEVFFQPMNLIGYYPRIHLGAALRIPSGVNISIMAAVRISPGFYGAKDFTIKEFRPEISYYLLKPYYKVNVRVGLEALFTFIDEKRHNDFYITQDGESIDYTSATLLETRKGLRLIATMVLQPNNVFVFEPYVGLGVASRTIDYKNVYKTNPPQSLKEAFSNFNISDTNAKLEEGNSYYFVPTIGLKIGLRLGAN